MWAESTEFLKAQLYTPQSLAIIFVDVILFKACYPSNNSFHVLRHEFHKFFCFHYRKAVDPADISPR